MSIDSLLEDPNVKGVLQEVFSSNGSEQVMRKSNLFLKGYDTSVKTLYFSFVIKYYPQENIEINYDACPGYN